MPLGMSFSISAPRLSLSVDISAGRSCHGCYRSVTAVHGPDARGMSAAGMCAAVSLLVNNAGVMKASYRAVPRRPPRSAVDLRSGQVSPPKSLQHVPVARVRADQLREGVGELLGAGAHLIAQPVRGRLDRRHDLLAPAAVWSQPEPYRQ